MGKTPLLKERLASLERMGDRIGEYFLRGEVGRGSRGDVLLDNARLTFRTSIDETGGSDERGMFENCLVLGRIYKLLWVRFKYFIFNCSCIFYFTKKQSIL